MEWDSTYLPPQAQPRLPCCSDFIVPNSYRTGVRRHPIVTRNSYILGILGDGIFPICDTLARFAEAVFAYMRMDTLAEQFEREVAEFLERTRLTPSEFGERAVGDGKFVGDVHRGRSPRLVTVDRVRAFMRDYDRTHGLDHSGDIHASGNRRGEDG